MCDCPRIQKHLNTVLLQVLPSAKSAEVLPAPMQSGLNDQTKRISWETLETSGIASLYRRK